MSLSETCWKFITFISMVTWLIPRSSKVFTSPGIPMTKLQRNFVKAKPIILNDLCSILIVMCDEERHVTSAFYSLQWMMIASSFYSHHINLHFALIVSISNNCISSPLYYNKKTSFEFHSALFFREFFIGLLYIPKGLTVGDTFCFLVQAFGSR